MALRTGSKLDPLKTAKFDNLAQCVEANIEVENDPVGYCIMKFPELKTSDLVVNSAKLLVAQKKKKQYGISGELKKKRKKGMDAFLLLETLKNLSGKMNEVKLNTLKLKSAQLLASLSPTDEAMFTKLLKSLQNKDIAQDRDKLTEHLMLRQDVAGRLEANPESDILKQELEMKDNQLTFMIEDILHTDKKERGGIPEITMAAKLTAKLLTSKLLMAGGPGSGPQDGDKRSKKEQKDDKEFNRISSKINDIDKDIDSKIDKNNDLVVAGTITKEEETSKNEVLEKERTQKLKPLEDKIEKLSIRGGKIETGKLRSGSLVDEFKTANGDRFVSYFLLNSDVNLKGWGVTGDSIPQHIGSFKNMPFVITSSKFFAKSEYGEMYDHPSTEHFANLGIKVGRNRPRKENDMMQQASFQEEFRVGNIEEVIQGNDGNWLAFIKIKPEFASMEMPPLVSPAIFQLNSSEPVDKISTWVGMHLAGLDERPAYGNVALFKGSCTGDKGSCLTQLSASMNSQFAYLPPCGMKKLFNARLKVAQMKMAAMTSDLHTNIQRQNIHGCKKNEKKC